MVAGLRREQWILSQLELPGSIQESRKLRARRRRRMRIKARRRPNDNRQQNGRHQPTVFSKLRGHQLNRHVPLRPIGLIGYQCRTFSTPSLYSTIRPQRRSPTLNKCQHVGEAATRSTGRIPFAGGVCRGSSPARKFRRGNGPVGAASRAPGASRPAAGESWPRRPLAAPRVQAGRAAAAASPEQPLQWPHALRDSPK